MGEVADSMINGEFDCLTGEYIGEATGYPRTRNKDHDCFEDPRNEEKYAKSTKSIRKELAILIKEKHKSCKTEKERNIAVNDAREFINKKYGKGWRFQL